MEKHVISCHIFKDIVDEIIKQYSLEYSTEYLDISGHNYPDKLKQELQNRINRVKDVNQIILLYGICGNATNGLTAKDIPIMIPRVHDCCSLLLGGNKFFLKHFSNRLSSGWASYAYEKGNYDNEYQSYLKKYDEDTAKYLIETLYPKASSMVYIDMNHPTDESNLLKYQKNYEVEVIKGNRSYIERILLGNSSLKEVHVIKPGEGIQCIYDYKEVMTSK